MSDDEVCWDMPTEILLNILGFLPPKHLIKCREVCRRWKSIVDAMVYDDRLWREHCERDFKSIYKSVRHKAQPGLLWYHIYRSLSLWPKLSSAKEFREEFASATSIDQDIRNFTILPNGVIGVHKLNSIVYYNIGTLKQSHRASISGEYVNYSENDHAIVTSSYHQLLYIVRKTVKSELEQHHVTFDDVKTFLLVDQKVYFASMQNEVFVCDLDDDNMVSKYIIKLDENIICLGFTNRLNILTFQRNIYSIIDMELYLTCSFAVESNLLNYIHEYNMLEGLDWRVYFQWVYILNQNIPLGPSRDIVVIRPHGDMFFVGSNWGVLRIYYAPYSSGELDLFNSAPIKQYNFMEGVDKNNIGLTMCPILQIDVVEIQNGHTVIVAIPKKIIVLNLIHDFN